LDIHFTVGTSYKRAAPLAEKNATAGLSDFSVRGAAWWYFSRQVAQNFHGKFHIKMNAQSACTLNILIYPDIFRITLFEWIDIT
jgi:hypothetical protein